MNQGRDEAQLFIRTQSQTIVRICSGQAHRAFSRIQTIEAPGLHDIAAIRVAANLLDGHSFGAEEIRLERKNNLCFVPCNHRDLCGSIAPSPGRSPVGVVKEIIHVKAGGGVLRPEIGEELSERRRVHRMQDQSNLF